MVVTGSRVSEARAAIGTDHPTATVAITSDALLSAPAGITGLKMLESLPGFNVQANDALGMYEFGNSVSVRAFNFQQIGFLLDDIPMGRSDQFGGSPIYRYVDNENLSTVQASAGAGDVALPSYSSLGPIVSYITADPQDTFGVRLSQTFGSDALRRTFARVESGDIGGFSGYVSGSRIRGDLWRGPGTISRDHVEGKAPYKLGERAHAAGRSQRLLRLRLAVDHAGSVSRHRERHLRPRRGASSRISTTSRRCRRRRQAFSSPTPPTTSSTSRRSTVARTRWSACHSLAPVTDALSFRTTAYYEDKDGYGVSPEAYATSLSSYNAERNIIPGLTGSARPAVRTLDRRRRSQRHHGQDRIQAWRKYVLGRRLGRARHLSPHPGSL